MSAPGSLSPNRPRLWYARQEEAAKKRHERLVTQWKEIRRLYLAGMDLREIRRELGVSVRTVYRYKDLTGPPPRRRHKRRASVLDPDGPTSYNGGTRAATMGRGSTERSLSKVTPIPTPTSPACSRSSGAPPWPAGRSR